ncbi:MAG: ABC transporter substrate-binding protein [Treponema sp.]|jgi:NitT/TauT family transport system substrate-binding protein|nr:ABC transporter substrate-binding protein [Treponema sp.]
MKRERDGKTIAVLAITAALAVLALGGCSKRTARGTGDLRDFTLPYDITGTGNPLVAIAYDLKYFEEEGLNVILQPLSTGGNVDQLMAVSTGKIDVANSGGTVAPALFIEQGNDLVIIGGTMGEGAALIARPENVGLYANFTRDSLNGKRVGVRRANTGDVALRGWLAKQGTDLSKITFIELDGGPTIIEAVRNGSVDVGSVYVNFRQVAEQQGLPVFLHIDTLTANFPCCRISTTRNNLDERREDYVAFFKALIRAYRFFNLDHERSLDITDRHYEADRDLLQSMYYDYGHYTLNPDPEKLRIIDFYEGMVSIGYAQGAGDVPGHIDSTVYRDALDQILERYPDDPFYQDVKRHFDENN